MAGLVSPLGHTCEFDVRTHKGWLRTWWPQEYPSPNTRTGAWSDSPALAHVGPTPGATLGAAQPSAAPCPRAGAAPGETHAPPESPGAEMSPESGVQALGPVFSGYWPAR